MSCKIWTASKLYVASLPLKGIGIRCSDMGLNCFVDEVVFIVSWWHSTILLNVTEPHRRMKTGQAQ